MAVIELGDVTTARSPEPAAGPVRRPGPRRHRRWALLVAVLAVLACHASVPAAGPALRLLWTGARIPGDTVVVAGDKAYRISGGARAEVVAWSLADGTRLWRWGADGHLIDLHPPPGDGPLLVEVDPVSAGDGPAALAARTTIALRAATGAELWRRPAAPLPEAVGEDTALLLEHDVRGGISGLTAVRTADGTPVWSRRGAPLREVTAVPAEDRVVTGAANGDVTVRRLSDGAVVASRNIPVRVQPPPQSRYTRLTAGNGLLLVFEFGDDRSRSVAYRLDTLRPMPLTGSDHTSSSPCGSVTCAADDDGFVVLDPATGRELWRADELFPSVVTADRILTGEAGNADHVLLDSRTGRRLTGTLHGWLVSQTTYDDSLLLLRPTNTPLGRTAVVRVDLRTGRTHVLGSVEPMPDQQSCQSTPGYLVCLAWDEILVAGVPR